MAKIANNENGDVELRREATGSLVLLERRRLIPTNLGDKVDLISFVQFDRRDFKFTLGFEGMSDHLANFDVNLFNKVCASFELNAGFIAEMLEKHLEHVVPPTPPTKPLVLINGKSATPKGIARLDKSVDELGLPPRARAGLAHENIRYIGELIQYQVVGTRAGSYDGIGLKAPDSIRRVKDFGRKSVRATKEALLELHPDLNFGTKLEGWIPPDKR